jgi:hypothetical protein
VGVAFPAAGRRRRMDGKSHRLDAEQIARAVPGWRAGSPACGLARADHGVIDNRSKGVAATLIGFPAVLIGVTVPELVSA